MGAPSADDLIAAIEANGDRLSSAGGPGDRLPRSAVDALRDLGVLRLGWPAELGGVEAGVADAIRVVEALAAVDPATAWVATVGSYHAGFVGAYAGEHAAHQVLDAEAPVAGQVAPVGRARRVDGGYLVSGRWSFASGIDHASWLLSGALVDATPGGGGNGDTATGARPRAIDVVVPIERARVVAGSWDAAGLEATGSCDYALDEVFVPDGFAFDFPAPRRQRGGPVYDVPLRAHVMVLHAGFPLGVARTALEVAATTAAAKARPLSEGTVGGRATFRAELGRHQVQLGAARLAALDVARRLDEAAAAGRGEAAGALLPEARAVSRLATDVAVDATTWAFRSAGGAALSRRGRLQQLLRDLLAAGQHAYVDEVAYEQLGTVTLEAAVAAGRRTTGRSGS